MSLQVIQVKDDGFGLNFTSDDISTAVTLQEAPDSSSRLVIVNMSVSSSVAESAVKLFILGSRESATSSITRRYQAYINRSAPLCVSFLKKPIKLPAGHMITAYTSGAAMVAINLSGDIDKP